MRDECRFVGMNILTVLLLWVFGLQLLGSLVNLLLHDPLDSRDPRLHTLIESVCADTDIYLQCVENIGHFCKEALKIQNDTEFNPFLWYILLKGHPHVMERCLNKTASEYNRTASFTERKFKKFDFNNAFLFVKAAFASNLLSFRILVDAVVKYMENMSVFPCMNDCFPVFLREHVPLGSVLRKVATNEWIKDQFDGWTVYSVGLKFYTDEISRDMDRLITWEQVVLFAFIQWLGIIFCWIFLVKFCGCFCPYKWLCCCCCWPST